MPTSKVISIQIHHVIFFRSV